MKVLIVGGGGREHALAWKAAQSRKVQEVFVAPGNAGTGTESGIKNVAINAESLNELADFALREKIDLTIIGPENPLVDGIVDLFHEKGLKCFGPTKSAAILEGSKSFTKEFLKRHQIPTAGYAVFTEVKPAIDYVREQRTPIVIKADGLAAGKGVVIAETGQDAIDTIESMLAGNQFGNAGHRIVIEEYLRGEEVSFIVMSDGEHILPLASSQDHKARDDGDKGPNTGGMGAYSPAPVITDDLYREIMAKIIGPTIRGLADEDRQYTGFLYAGLMITEDGSPKVLEYNCRLGDPETQPVLMRLKSDLVDLCMMAVKGKLHKRIAEWDERVAMGVVLASRGYPASASKGDIISGLDQTLGKNIKVFHAGTKDENGNCVTAGGRVLCVTGLGDNVTEVQRSVYSAIDCIKWDGMFYRKDIGYRAIARETSSRCN